MVYTHNSLLQNIHLIKKMRTPMPGNKKKCLGGSKSPGSYGQKEHVTKTFFLYTDIIW
jgi:hypothetical protein